MRPGYDGLHTFEWGYLFASLIAMLAWISLWSNHKAAKEQAPSDHTNWQSLMSLGLYTSTALAIAVDTSRQEDDPLIYLFWLSAMMVVILSMTNWFVGSRDKQNASRLNHLSIKIAFLGLLCWIFLTTALEIGMPMGVFEDRIRVSDYLTPSMRKAVISLVDPLFFVGLFALIFANFLLLLQFLKARFLNQLLTNPPIRIRLILVVLFPTILGLQLFIPYGAEFWQPLGYYAWQSVLFLILIILAFSAVCKSVFGGLSALPKSYLREVLTTGLVVSAAYSFTPITSSLLGNFEYVLFWVFMIVYVLSDVAYLKMTGQQTESSDLAHTAPLLALLGLLVAALSFVMWETGPYPNDPGVAGSIIGEVRALLRPWHGATFIVATAIAGSSMLLALRSALLQRRVNVG